jgi:signal transduction histidine kinase
MVYSPYRDKDGAVKHAVFVAWDNTEEKNATDTVRDLNRALEQRVEERTAELQDTLQELEAFNYTIAHDLRSPLRFLRSFAHMLEEESGERLGDSGRYFCTMIAQGVAEMQHMIDRLLDFSRLSRKPVLLGPCDLEAVIASAWETVSVGEIMALDLQPLPSCQGDPSLLKQVFVNLLENAIKFTRGVESPRAAVYTEASPPDTVQICVRDNGIGFHMNHAEAMFAPFKQIHDQAGNQGSGLGLAIVRRIVERHGGSVWSDGEEGVGAAIHIRLGACEKENSTSPSPASPIPLLK